MRKFDPSEAQAAAALLASEEGARLVDAAIAAVLGLVPAIVGASERERFASFILARATGKLAGRDLVTNIDGDLPQQAETLAKIAYETAGMLAVLQDEKDHNDHIAPWRLLAEYVAGGICEATIDRVHAIARVGETEDMRGPLN